MVAQLQQSAAAVDKRMASGSISLFHGGGRVSTSALDPADRDSSTDADCDSSGGDAEAESLSGSSSNKEGEDSEGSMSDDSDGENDFAQAAQQRLKTQSDARGCQRRPVTAGEGLLAQTDMASRRISGHVGSNEDQGEGGSSESSESAEGDGERFARWRERMLQKQAALFSTRAGDLQRLVYGERAVADDEDRAELHNNQTPDGAELMEDLGSRDGGGDHDEEAGDFFTLKKAGDRRRGRVDATDKLGQDVDAVDASRAVGDVGGAVQRWLGAESADALAALKSRFVTGGAAAFEKSRQRAKAVGASEAGKGEDGDGAESEGEVFGDFEDVEGGIAYSGALPTVPSHLKYLLLEAFAGPKFSMHACLDLNEFQIC
jgi:hypothetical protein